MFPEVASAIVPPGLSFPLLLGHLDDVLGDTVLDAPAGVQELGLREHRPFAELGDGNQGGVPDEIKNVPCFVVHVVFLRLQVHPVTAVHTSGRGKSLPPIPSRASPWTVLEHTFNIGPKTWGDK